MASDQDTIFALSSGRPPAAIAVVRVSGPQAGVALRALIGKIPEPRRAALARVRDPQSHDIIDGALALWFPAPRSETGEDTVELQLHGGRAVIGAVLAALGRIEGCRPAEAGEQLRQLRAHVSEVARTEGVRYASAGTHPFSLFERQRITAKDRYRRLVEQMQYIARRELIFGMHIHVAVRDPDTCMKVMEGVLIELPILLALSSNSPFWRGEITGLASTRTAVFAGFPRSGLPPRFDSYDDYAESVGWLEGTGAIVDYTRLWWDVRPHPRLGTLEVRVMDVQFDLEYAMALTAYVQADEPKDSAQRANWLPAPKVDFSLYVRAYWPKPAVADGSWTPPAVKRTD